MKKHTPNESFARNTDGYRGIKPSKPSATLIRLDGNPYPQAPVRVKGFAGYGDMPNLPCARSTGKGMCTLGPLTKRRRVGVGPALGRDELNCLNRKPRRFLMVPARCGRKTRETERRSRKSGKADEALALKGETKENTILLN